MTYPIPDPGKGALYGKQWEARYAAQAGYEAGFTDAIELLTIVCIGEAESRLFDHAIHANFPGKDGVVHYDRGWLQLSDVHPDIPDEVAYDFWEAPKAARKLFLARKKAGGVGFEDWAAFTQPPNDVPVCFHDTYLAPAGRGVGNYLIDVMLNWPVPDISAAYQHRLSTPALNFEHRVAGALHWFQQAHRDLGWGAKSAQTVLKVQQDLSKGQAAAKQPLPN